MLLELRIRDLAVLRDLTLRLEPGLNVLTGETGAGKSILVGGLSLLLGERASSEAVRVGADRALVEAVFDISELPELHEQLELQGLPDEDGLLLLRREVQREGRNRAWINGSPATAGVLGSFGRALVDLHGQHDHQTLLDPDEQRTILDAHAEAAGAAGRVRRRHQELSRLQAELEARDARTRELEQRADFLRFQLEEIRSVSPEEAEDTRVEEELSRADHAEELAGEASAVHEALYAGEGAASEILAQARDRLVRLVRLDPGLAELRDLVESAFHQVTEAGRSAGSYASEVEVDPRRAETLRERSDALHRLKRKFGPSLSDVRAAAEGMARELDELDGAERARGALDRAVAQAQAALEEEAAALTALRAAGAERLAAEVRELLPELGMPGARFEVALEPRPVVGAGGRERVRFLASLNPGFEPAELAKIASGGELSRVMLALKTILARVDRVPTLVFDEVDAGIGGTVAVAVGRKLARVAEHHQVFVITHLPQVAARGSRHFRVEKVEEEGVAATRVTPLDGDERVLEIARMLGGDPESETSRRHAGELLVGS
ncbi:MAG: DNA repair protein RecN [Gemmatimonadales bacterium]|nr:MAG: DNA repair protein RecN [Gemmatimonadales bacterium]